MTKRACTTCKYKKDLGYSRYRGCNLCECHRFPPCAKREGSDIYSFFPVTNEDHWCWEWKPKGEE